MNLFLYYGYITEMQFNIIFRSRNVNKAKTEEDYLHEMTMTTPAVGRLIKELNLELCEGGQQRLKLSRPLQANSQSIAVNTYLPPLNHLHMNTVRHMVLAIFMWVMN